MRICGVNRDVNNGHAGSRQSCGDYGRRQRDRTRCAGGLRRKARKQWWWPTSNTKRRAVAAEIGGWEIDADVSSESDIQMAVDEVLKRYGQIDLVLSNASIGVEGDCCAPDRDWLRSWEINVMATYTRRVLFCRACWRAVKTICCRPCPPPGCSSSGSASHTAIKASKFQRCAPRT